jgi:hypothetical protein
LMWLLYPTHFSLFLLSDGGDRSTINTSSNNNNGSTSGLGSGLISAPSRAAAAVAAGGGDGGGGISPRIVGFDRGAPPAAPSPPVPTVNAAAAAAGGPSLGTGAVQLSAIQFTARCTATATFTTHRSWRVACGVLDHSRSAHPSHPNSFTRRRDSAVGDAFTHDQTPARRALGLDGDSPGDRQPGSAPRVGGHTPADYSPAAAGEPNDRLPHGHRANTPPPLLPTAPSKGEPSAGGVGAAGAANPLAQACAAAAPAELWSAFGFLNGDVLLYNHAARGCVKRHNSSKLSTRAVANSAVSAICRVEREGSPDEFHRHPLDAAAAAAAHADATAAASECSCTTGHGSDGTDSVTSGGGHNKRDATYGGGQRRHNHVTCIFGDLVVGFDNGTLLVIRLNRTGGFIDDSRGAWLGHAPVRVIKPCPAYPRVLALGCGDGYVRFLHFATSFVVSTVPTDAGASSNAGAAASSPAKSKKKDKGASKNAPPSDAGTCDGDDPLAQMDPNDVGTLNDPRVLAVTPQLSAHGGVSALDWVLDGTGLVVGCQDDAVTYVGVAIESALTPRRLRNVGSHGASPHNLPTSTAANDASGAPGGRVSIRTPPPLYVEVRGTVRRTFHRGWIRHLTVLPILTELINHHGEPMSPSSVSVDNAATGRDLATAPLEMSHVALCASEDGVASIWHLPSREQLAFNATHGGVGSLAAVGGAGGMPATATPSQRLQRAGSTMGNNTSFSLQRGLSCSFVPSGASRPMSASPARDLGASPSGGLFSATFAALISTTTAAGLQSGVGGGGVPTASLGRQPCALLPRLTRVVPSTATRSGTDTVLDDTIVAFALLPACPGLLPGSSALAPGAAGEPGTPALTTGRTGRLGSHDGGSVLDAADVSVLAFNGGSNARASGAPFRGDVPNAFVAVTAKGCCYLWSVEPAEYAN